MKRRNRAYRLLRLTAVYLLLLPFLLLGWLYSRLPDRVYLEPGQALLLPRFGWVEPMGLHGSQNAASTQVVGSYQTTLSLGGWLPIKNIRTVVTERAQVTVCGTPFGVKMFSEGALLVGFSDIDSPGGSTVNPAKAAGLRLGDRVIRIGQIRTENNDAVKEALEAAKLQAGLGMATDTGVLQAQSDLLSSQSQLDNLRNLSNNLRSQLCLLTGWKVDATPEIGTVPAADPSKIDNIDLAADILKAIGNNQTLISQRHASSTKSTAAIDNRLKNIDVSEQQLTVEMQRLYSVMQQKKVLYDAANTAYQKALLAKGAAERQYDLKMLSRLQYLGAEAQFYQAEGARKSADTALLQAMLDYDWAVQGYVSIPQ